MSTRRPTVILADDHPQTAAALRSLLEGPFDVIACVTDGEALVRAAERLSPDVIVSDIGMAPMDGIDAARLILATNRDARVVFVTVQSNVSVVERSLAEGVLGFVVKMVAGDELVPAVHAALRGQRHISGIAGFGGDGADWRDGAGGGSARRDGRLDHMSSMPWSIGPSTHTVSGHTKAFRTWSYETGEPLSLLPIGDVKMSFTVDPEETSPHLNTPMGDSAVSAAAAAAPSSFGRYQVQRVIGSGGFGKVYLAHDTELDRPVAIKVLRSANVSRPEVDQFLEEGRRVARLRHPGIVAVHDIGTHDGQLYIVSDYLSGPSLAEWLIANRPTWLDAARIVAAIADALAHAHSKRTLHRDVKPVNIIFTAEQHPVLVDFGLGLDEARAGGQQLGVVSGTPRYMAPEQVTGEAHRIDGRTDIYSLGVVLYEMLCGYVPFRGTDSQELLRQIRDDEPQPPRQLINDIPPALEDVCLRAMAKRMSDRYATAADLAKALRQIAAPTVETGRQVSPLVPASAPSSAPLDRSGTLSPTPSPAAITPSSRRLKREAERRQVTVLACGCDLFASDLFLEQLDAEDQAGVLRSVPADVRASGAAPGRRRRGMQRARLAWRASAIRSPTKTRPGALWQPAYASSRSSRRSAGSWWRDTPLTSSRGLASIPGWPSSRCTTMSCLSSAKRATSPFAWGRLPNLAGLSAANRRIG